MVKCSAASLGEQSWEVRSVSHEFCRGLLPAAVLALPPELARVLCPKGGLKGGGHCLGKHAVGTHWMLAASAIKLRVWSSEPRLNKPEESGHMARDATTDSCLA